MKINDKVIMTPAEDPLGYALDWRWQVAQAAMEAVPRAQVKDKDARALVQHLQRRQKSALKAGEKPTALDRVIAWRESPAAIVIEAFLLASDPEAAAAELSLLPPEVRLYSNLFCDLYDDQGKRRPAVYMNLQAHLEAEDNEDIGIRLKKIALKAGIHGLRQVLHASRPAKEPSLDELVEAELKRRLHAGELRTSDLTRLQANAITRERIAQDQKDDGPQQLMQSMELVRHILGLTAPNIVQTDRSEDRVAASTSAIRTRFAAQRNIAATPVTDDEDRGYEALNEMMTKQFRNAES